VTLSAEGVAGGLAAGAHAATLTVTGRDTDAGGAEAHGTPKQVSVTLVVRKQRPDVLLDKALLEFECIEGQTSPAGQTFTVTNSGEDATLYWWTSALPSWLSFSPADNTLSSGGGLAQGAFDTVTVSIVGPLTLPARKYYEATITIHGEGVGGEPMLGLNGRTIDVRLWVKVPQRIDFDVTSLTFTGAIEEVSDPPTATQSVTLTNGGEVDLDWTAAAPVYVPPATSWLTVDTTAVASPLGPGASGQVDFVVDSDAAGIAEGTYTATVEFSDPNASNSPRTVTVTVEVLPRAEIVCAGTLDFACYLGENPANQTLVLSNPGASGLVWTAADANYNPAAPPAWLSVTSGGTTPGGGSDNLTVSIDTSGIVTPGTYQADITITGTDEIGGQPAKGSPKTVQVTLLVDLPRPVAHWKLDDGAGLTALDSSGNGNDGALTGMVGNEWMTGKVDGALEFDGTDDFVDVPDGFADFTGGFTVALWAYPTAAKSWARFIDFGNGAGNDNIILMRDGGTDDLTFEAFSGGSSGGQVIVAGAIALNEWQHFAATIDASGGVVIYKNGAQVGIGTTAVPNNVTRTSNYIGESNWGGADEFYQGRMDDVRIYDLALSATEIGLLYDMGQVAIESVTAADPVPPNDPDDNDILSDGDTLTIVFDIDTNRPSWPNLTKAEVDGLISFENTLGANYTGQWTAPDTLVITVVDASGGTLAIGNTITVVADGTDDLTNAAGTNLPSTAAAPVSGYWGVILTTGLVGHWEFEEGSGQTAIDSTGNGNDGTLGSAAGADSSDPIWVSGKVGSNALSFDGDNDYVSIGSPDIAPPWTAALWVRREDSSNNEARLLDSGSYSLRLEQYDNTNRVGFTRYSGGDYAFNYEAPIGTWVHLAFVGTASSTSLYVNGVPQDINANSISVPMSRIGTGPHSQPWISDNRAAKGLIDDVRIYNRVLSTAEIQALAGM